MSEEMDKKGKAWLELAHRDPRTAAAGLARLPFEARLDLLMSLPAKEKVRLLDLAPDGGSLIRALPEQELFFAIQEIGKWDAVELLSEADARQIRFLFDLDCWRRDELDPQKLLEWFMVLWECGEEKVYETIQEMDPDLLALFLKLHLRVVREGSYGLDGFEPEDLQREDFHTIDHQYFFEFLDPDLDNQIFVRLLDLLFREDGERYFRLMEAAIGELSAELEAEAFRWREGRLSEQGFPELSQAMELYQFVEPSTFNLDQRNRRYLPLGGGVVEDRALIKASYYLSLPQEESFFSQALGLLSAEAKEEIRQELVLLFNQALLAEAIDLSEPEEVRRVLHRVHHYLNIGLEYMGQGELAKADRVLQDIYLKRIFHVGFSLVQKLRRRAGGVRREGLFLKGPKASELGSPYRRILTGLCRRHPLIYTGIGPDGAPQYRELQCLADVREMERLLVQGPPARPSPLRET